MTHGVSRESPKYSSTVGKWRAAKHWAGFAPASESNPKTCAEPFSSCRKMQKPAHERRDQNILETVRVHPARSDNVDIQSSVPDKVDTENGNPIHHSVHQKRTHNATVSVERKVSSCNRMSMCTDTPVRRIPTPSLSERQNAILLPSNHALHVWILLASIVVRQNNLSGTHIFTLQLRRNVARGVVCQLGLVWNRHRRQSQLVHAEEMSQHQTAAVNQSAQCRLKQPRYALASAAFFRSSSSGRTELNKMQSVLAWCLRLSARDAHDVIPITLAKPCPWSRFIHNVSAER